MKIEKNINKEEDIKVNDILKILTTFNYSINIQRDYESYEKINFYMPTYKNLNLIHKYVETITGNNKKSFILSGAYGTGKSYLISILLNFLSNTFNEKEIAGLIKKSSKGVYGDIDKLINTVKDKSYFIVFADDSFQDFRQSIIMGILKQAKINNIEMNIPTIFKIILDKIEKWEKDYGDIIKKINYYLENNDMSLESFKEGLNNYDEKTLKIFEEMYIEIFAGEKFIPLGSINKIGDILREVENAVLSTGKYEGIIYVFDEFGRYLESNINSVDVKQIQDMAEYCNEEVKKSTFIAITHKDIFQYSNKLKNKEMRNEWEKVSGRFNKEHLVYEKQNIMDIIEKILEKKEEFELYYNKYLKEYAKKLENNKLANGISSNPRMLLEKYFPLNYLTVKILPALSQKIAQNERTLFSFICGEEKNGLQDILKNNKGGFLLVSLPELYDYFENSFKFLEVDSLEYKTYLNTKSIITKLENKMQIEIIKSLAVLYIYNNFNDIEPTKDTLIFALNISENDFDKAQEFLIDEGFISYRNHTRYYKIKDEIDINIDNAIVKKAEDIKNIEYAKLLNEAIPLEYYYPLKYNLENRITRYIKKYYIEIKNITEIEKIAKDKEADGKIVYLLEWEKSDNNIEEIIKEYNSEIIFISNTESNLEITEELRYFDAIGRLLNEKNEIVINEVIRQELEAYREELKKSMKIKLDLYFDWKITNVYFNECKTNKIKSDIDFMEKVTEYFETKYSNYKSDIQIGYELINKNNLTSQIKRYRLNILKKLEDNPEIIEDNSQEYFEQTGAENSLARNILKRTGIYNNRKINFENSKFKTIYEEIINKIKDKINIGELYNLFCYSGNNYGMRRGVFSFILALIILQHKNEIVINTEKDNEEKKFTSNMIDMIESSPSKYEISLIKHDESREEFLDNVLNLLKIFTDENRNLTKANHAFIAFRNFILSLPKIVIAEEYKDKAISKVLRGFLGQNNPMYFWFIKLPKEYNKSDFKDILTDFENDIEFLNSKEAEIRNNLKQILLDSIGLDTNKIGEWLDKKENKINPLYQWLESKYEIGVKDERSFLIAITEKIQGFDYYNWRTIKDIEEFQKKISINVQDLKKDKENNLKRVKISDGNKEIMVGVTEKDISAIGKVLKSKLTADLKNIGISVSNEEKKKILLELLMDNS